MRIGLDTNVLYYAEGLDDAARMQAARDILARLPKDRTVVPAQAFGEMFSLLVRKARVQPIEARRRIGSLADSCETWPTSLAAFQAALDLAAGHSLQIWDAIILAAAAEAGCGVLLSEDMQHGVALAGVMIVDPFRDPLHALLVAALNPKP